MIDINHPDWLTEAMTKYNVETGRLAKLSGVSRSQIQRIRKGMSPRLDTLLRIQSALEDIAA